MKRPIYIQIMFACLIPLIIIFSLVLLIINRVVYTENTLFAEDFTKSFAEESSQQINNKFENITGLLSLASKNLAEYSKNPSTEKMIEQLTMSILETTPNVNRVWVVFEANAYLPGKRFSRSYFNKDGNIVEIFIVGDDVLNDFISSPWYNIPLATGKAYFDADYHDYSIEERDLFIGTVTYPIKRDGKTIGCVGLDILFDKVFEFLDEKQIEGAREVLLLSKNGAIVYSPNKKYSQKTIQDLPFENSRGIISNMKNNITFSYEGYSPFFRKHSMMYFNPIFYEFANKQLYLYVDLPTDALYASAKETIQVIITVSIIGFILLMSGLFYKIRSIVEPIKKITENANKIAEGSLDIDIDADVIEATKTEENIKTQNEVDILYIAIRKMLIQLTQIQALKLEAIESKHEKDKAEESSRAKSDFLARMSHEIRTPMNAIIGMSELILRENIPPRIYEHAFSIKHASSGLLSIINDILDFSKIESKRLEIVSAEYSFASLMHDVISIIRMRIIEKPIFFVTNIDGNIPNKLIGDEVRLRQILLNLLSNAVQYTKEGFISITIDGVVKEGSVILTIAIADSGVGIKEENIEKTFEAFVQLDTIKNKGILGTGLGLSITKSLCQAMGGDISVSSKYGSGSIFTVVIPQEFNTYEKYAIVENPNEKQVLIYEVRSLYAHSIARSLDNLGVTCTLVDSNSEFYEELKRFQYPFVFVSSFLFESVKVIVKNLDLNPRLILLAEFEERINAPNTITAELPLHCVSIANILNNVVDVKNYNERMESGVLFIAPEAHVLIVDDIRTNLKVAEGLMAPYKMRVDVCESGIEAIKLIKSNKYDIVFMDHMMPDMDGIEATNIIRVLEDGNLYYKNLPIIALTANAVFGVREMFLQNGLNDFLAKPIEISKLNAVLEKWIPQEKQEKYRVEEPNHVAADFEIEGIDVEAGIFMTGETIEGYKKTLAVFYKDGLEKIDEIKNCMKKKHLLSYTIVMHGLKSAAASIGAAKISDMAKALEDAGKKEDREFIENNTKDFLKELAVLLQNISYVILKNQADDEIAVGSEREFLKKELIRMKEAFEKMDIRTIDNIMNWMQSRNWDSETDAAIEIISKKILLFDYDEALELMEELINQ